MLVERGMRGRLSTGSLLTGQLYIELNMFPDTPIQLVGGTDAPYPELPTIVGAFEAMTQSIEIFMSKLEEINVNAIGDEILEILSGTSDLLNKPEQEETVTDLQASIRSLRNILRKFEEADLDETIGVANDVLANIDGTLIMIDQVLEPNSPLQYNVIKVTSELEETAKAIRSLVETLERHPESLIFGRQTEGGDTER
jgi:paraquat-inducible protein B